MVTIEQKLAMFSKLLHRSMDEKFAEEMGKIKTEYEVKLQKNKDAVDKEAEDILKKSSKRAEMEKVELISKIRVEAKKEALSSKEKYYSVLMGNLKTETDKFIKSDKYGNYLATLVKKLLDTEQLSDSLIIYMTSSDCKEYEEQIKQELLKDTQRKLSFEKADDSIIGGFIVKDPNANIRMDFSIAALFEDNKAYIMQKLFQAIEAGEPNGI